MKPVARAEMLIRRPASEVFDASGLRVDIRLAGSGRGKTRVAVEVTGFKGRDAASQAIDATEGFAIVLCDLKSLLESGRSGRMVRDKAALLAAAP